jgi:hypothetical protein
MIERGLVYIGEERKNFTQNRYYTMSYIGFSCCIKDNFGASKIYYTDNIWFKKNFKIMKKEEYILWSRAIKLRKLDLI